MRTRGLEPDGFVVSLSITEKEIEGLKVYNICEILDNNTNFCVVITVFDTSKKMEINNILDNLGIDDYLFWKS